MENTGNVFKDISMSAVHKLWSKTSTATVSRGGQVDYAPDFHPGSPGLTLAQGNHLNCALCDHKLQT